MKKEQPIENEMLAVQNKVAVDRVSMQAAMNKVDEIDENNQ